MMKTNCSKSSLTAMRLRIILIGILFVVTHLFVGAAQANAKLFSFKTYNGGPFVVAQGGGTDILTTGNQTLELFGKFDIVTMDAALRNGSIIQIRCFNSQFVSAENGGGGQVNCNRNSAHEWETFKILQAVGTRSLILPGDYVRIKASNGMFLRTPRPDGSGGVILANGHQNDKADLFKIDSFDGQLPPLDQFELHMASFPGSSFPANPETPMGGCTLSRRDSVVFEEPVPNGSVVGIWTQLSCLGSANGVRINPEYYKGVSFKNGWHVTEFVAPDTSVNGCNGSVTTSPVIGSHTPYVQLHMACPPFKSKAENIVKVSVAGPQGFPMQ